MAEVVKSSRIKLVIFGKEYINPNGRVVIKDENNIFSINDLF